jgi:septum formation protein
MTRPPPPIVLASRSPRRAELLRQIGVPFEAVDANVPERWDGSEAPGDYVLRVASAKARAGRRMFPDRIVLGADTEVVLDGEVLGKPHDRAHFVALLQRLSGRSHQVYSAVAVCTHTLHTALSVTQVWFRPLGEAEIAAYWDTGEPGDKAGGYAIQGHAAAFIERIDGSYSGVMGLPLFETARLLATATPSPLAGEGQG